MSKEVYNMTVWGSRIKPGREEFHEIKELELKVLLWDRFPGGFEIKERKEGYWILRDEKRVGEIIEVVAPFMTSTGK